RAGGAAGRAAGGQQGLVDGLPAERRPEGAMALPARGMGLESVEELEATSPAQRPGAAARVRAAARALPVGDPGPLPLAAGNQSGRRHQQQDQGHQAGGLRLPGRRLLLPEDPGGLPRTWVKNQKKAAAPKERPPMQQVGRLLEGLEAQTVRLGAFLAEAALLVLLVLAIVALDDLHVRITLDRQNVRGDTVQEPAIVADHQRHARELQQRILERTQRLHVEIVGRLVEQQHVAALQQRLGQVQTAALTAGERADQLLLVRALEVETADVGARLDLDTVDVEDVGTAGDLLEHRVVALQRRAALVDIGQLHGGAEDDLAGVRLLLARDHLEQRRLAGAVGADDADDGAVGDDQREIVDQQPVAEALADVAELDDVVAQALARRNEDLVGLLPLLVLDRLQLLQAGQARLALGTAALGVLPGPFQLALNGLLAGLLLVLFLPEALVLLLEPLGVVALPGNAAAAVQLEDPLGGVVEEVAVMGDGHHRARVALQELLQPFHRFGVEVVGGLV